MFWYSEIVFLNTFAALAKAHYRTILKLALGCNPNFSDRSFA